MNAEDIKDTVKRELPNWLREDPAFRTYVMELTRGEYADHRETSDRFCDILGELRRDRERQDQKRAENNREWDENQAALAPMREEDALQWDENQSELKRLHEQFMEPARKSDRGIGALGSRWGKQSDKAFRDALAAILEQSFDVQVVFETYGDSTEVESI